jgi:hypothetical protein
VKSTSVTGPEVVATQLERVVDVTVAALTDAELAITQVVSRRPSSRNFIQ